MVLRQMVEFSLSCRVSFRLSVGDEDQRVEESLGCPGPCLGLSESGRFERVRCGFRLPLDFGVVLYVPGLLKPCACSQRFTDRGVRKSEMQKLSLGLSRSQS